MTKCETLILGAAIGAAAIIAFTKEKTAKPSDPPKRPERFPPPPCGCEEPPRPRNCKDCYYRIYRRC